MKKFLIRCIALFLGCAILIGIGCYIQKDDILCITDSTSLDARLYNIHENKISDVDIASLGASINMNSLNSQVFVENLDADGIKYYNYANWGIRMGSDMEMLKCILRTSDPKVVIMFSHIVDFYPETFYDGLDWDMIGDYMDTNPLNDVEAYLRGGYPYNKETKEKYLEYTTQKADQYENLKMDAWGGSFMNVPEANRNEERWNETLDVAGLDLSQLDDLREMARYLKERGIAFVYVQTPFRENFQSSEGAAQTMEEFYNSCNTILAEEGQYYYNAVDFAKYTDEYFSDASHVNLAGSEMLTEEFTEWFNEQGILNEK